MERKSRTIEAQGATQSARAETRSTSRVAAVLAAITAAIAACGDQLPVCEMPEKKAEVAAAPAPKPNVCGWKQEGDTLRVEIEMPAIDELCGVPVKVTFFATGEMTDGEFRADVPLEGEAYEITSAGKDTLVRGITASEHLAIEQ